MALDFKFIVTRALLVGLVVGALMGLYMVFVVEPVVDDAIALEEQMSAAEPAAEDDHTHEEGASEHSHGEEVLFTRPEQKVAGVVANILYAVIVAGIFGTVYAAIRHKVPGRSEYGRVIWLASLAFVAVALLPAIKYPANPPAVGDPDTVTERTVQYVALIVVSLVLAWALVRLSRYLHTRLSDPERILVMTAVSIIAVGVVLIVLPGTPDTIDPAVPADLVWRFRIRSLGGLALLWMGLGLGLGWVLERATAPSGDAPADIVGAAR